MFTNVVETYDLINRILTWGLDKVWREACAKECLSSGIVLDLCCGTGDLALYVSKHASPSVSVLGVDFSKAMLYRAVNKRAKAERKESCRIKKGQEELGVDTCNVSFILADAGHLPFKNECIDRIAISFSFRNLVYGNPLAKIYLKEVLRTLRPRGRLVCVETSQPRTSPLRFLYHLYLRKVVPLVGGLMSGQKGAYRYLGISAIHFPSGGEIAEMLLSAGFREISFKPMTLGVVGLHVGIK
ncbi:ubiquinone/menaquinone biosynthesis methyltransferase [Candidatus Bathyarchaeota archaeon]|nr:ubiquinone/menaquinone biosynthesis methyltransferase [Candidatus Bathyarchaeota archaeon]NIV67732.1 ubiquinone/menaquinone biosynthesis methyltransferase [Candidatus Bathyarchaeota archaeon]NIW34337.1 ubiquinone/menaquinone biosynthesis methyltransferase [Candidatus Bathyarchaeota archaeon]